MTQKEKKEADKELRERMMDANKSIGELVEENERLKAANEGTRAGGMEWFDQCKCQIMIDTDTCVLYCQDCGSKKGIYVKQTPVPPEQTPANEGTPKGSNDATTVSDIEVWKCEGCGVWEGCVHKQLKGNKPPFYCARYPDSVAKWERRSDILPEHFPTSATAPQQPNNDKVIMMIEARIKRYNLDDKCCMLLEAKNGRWVFYKDLLKILREQGA